MNNNNNSNSYNNNNNVWTGGNPITLPLGAWVGNTSQGNSRETPTAGLQQPWQLLAFLISIISVAGRERQCTAISHSWAPRTGQCTITDGVISASTGKPVGITALEHFHWRESSPRSKLWELHWGVKWIANNSCFYVFHTNAWVMRLRLLWKVALWCQSIGYHWDD